MDDCQGLVDRDDNGEYKPNDAGWEIVTHWCPKCGAVVTNGDPSTGEHKPGCPAKPV